MSLRETLQKLELSAEQFVDMCLLAGWGACRTFPPVETELGRFSFAREPPHSRAGLSPPDCCAYLN